MKKLLFSVVCLLLILNILTAQHHEEIESLQSRFDNSDLVVYNGQRVPLKTVSLCH